MIVKNLKKYMEKFKSVPCVQFDRVKEYISSNRFSKKNLDFFHNELKKFISREKKVIKMVLYIIPEPTPRPRLAFDHFYVKNSSSNNKFVEILVKSNEDIFSLVKSECKLVVNSYLPIPKSFNKIEVLLAELGIKRPSKKPDWDNLGKTYSDMIQKWIISDDAYIVDGESHKYYSLKPRVEIIIEYFDDNI